MKNCIKKSMLIILLSILIFAFNSCYASTIDVTNYENNFKEVVPDGNKVVMQDNQITITPAGTDKEAVTMTYSLSALPVFTTKVTLQNNMTYKEYVKEMAKYTYFEYCFKALKGEIGEDKANDLASYFTTKTASLEVQNMTEASFNASIAMSTLKQKYVGIIEDDVFKLAFETEEDTASKLEIKIALKIKAIDGSSNIKVSAESKSNTNTTTTNTNTLPATGDEEDIILAILYTVITISTMGVIGLLYTLKKEER